MNTYLYIDLNTKRVGATLAVALNQGGGKPRPYKCDNRSAKSGKYTDTEAQSYNWINFSIHPNPYEKATEYGVDTPVPPYLCVVNKKINKQV